VAGDLTAGPIAADRIRRPIIQLTAVSEPKNTYITLEESGDMSSLKADTQRMGGDLLT
jgi:hypothetical protein